MWSAIHSFIEIVRFSIFFFKFVLDFCNLDGASLLLQIFIRRMLRPVNNFLKVDDS